MSTTMTINISQLVETLKTRTNDVIFITTDNLSNKDHVHIHDVLASEPDVLLSESDVNKLVKGKQLNRHSKARKFLMRDEHSATLAGCIGDIFILTSNGTCRRNTVQIAESSSMHKEHNLFIVNFF